MYFVVFSVAVFCCLGSNTEQLNIVDAWKGHRSFVFMMCYWADTYIGHRPSSCFTVAQHFGNSLQNMFYRQCPVFTTCVSYSTLHIFDLNFWSHLLSMNANQECRKYVWEVSKPKACLHTRCVYCAMYSVHKMPGALPWDESYATPVQCWMSVGRQTEELQIVNVGKCAWWCTLQPLAPTKLIISYH